MTTEEAQVFLDTMKSQAARQAAGEILWPTTLTHACGHQHTWDGSIMADSDKNTAERLCPACYELLTATANAIREHILPHFQRVGDLFCDTNSVDMTAYDDRNRMQSVSVHYDYVDIYYTRPGEDGCVPYQISLADPDSLDLIVAGLLGEIKPPELQPTVMTEEEQREWEQLQLEIWGEIRE